ncbi:sensor histidine kinase [Flammeovirga agarivorans]|uniref:histidine kinase n=1 Tax=Flammeovirga agarivorans TaxID=2726742 RepID=A0A7X8SMS0_9BACT|nr:PAS domain-containing protein [Flammeovirga agarivorans]NLR93040.1 PAS domain-containing protein [Flammeovirga agarivorans]
MSSTRVILYILFLLPFQLFSQGLDPTTPIQFYERKSWNKIEETPVDRVFDITQDSIGFMWIASDRGLLKFDGSKAKVYNLFSDPIIETESIRNVCVTPNNQVWFCTRRGLFYLDNQKVKQVYEENGDKVKTINSLFSDQNGRVWFVHHNKLRSFDNGTISTHNYTDNKKLFKIFPFTEGTIYGLRSFKTHAIIDLWDKNSEKVIKTKKFNFRIFSIKPLGNLLYIGGLFGQIYKYDWDTDHLELLYEKDSPFDNRIHQICIQKDSTIWAAGLGLHRITNNKISSLYDKEDITHSNTFCSYLDKNENLWVGTRTGLNYFSNTAFSKIKEDDSAKNIFHQVMVYFKNRVIIGSRQNGLFELKDGIITKLVLDKEIGKTINSLSTSHDNKLYVSTNKGGFELDEIHQKLRVCQQIVDKPINFLCKTNNGQFIYNFEEDVYRKDKQSTVNIFSKNILIEYHKALGKEWITSTKGLFTIEDGEMIPYSANNTLDKKYLFTFSYDMDSSFWVSTYGSGIVHIRKDASPVKYDTRSNLPSNVSMLVTMNDKIGKWFYLKHGEHPYFQKISPIELDGKMIINQGVKFRWHFENEEYHFGGQNPIRLDTKEQVYISSRHDIYTFSPDKIHYSPSKLFLGDVFIDGERQINLPQQIEANNKQLEFHLSVLDFAHEGNHFFEYKLNGYDKDWVKMGSRSIAYYNNLPAGNYTFEARIRNADNEYTYLTNTYHFIKLEYWYKTNYAIFLYLFLLCIIVYLLFRWRINTIENQKRILQQKVDQRTFELQNLNENLENIVQERTEQLTLLYDELTESEERLKYALEASKDGIWDYHITSDQLVINEAALNILGYNSDSCDPTKGISPFIHPNDQEKWQHYFATSIQQKKVDNFEDQDFRFYHKNGKQLWIAIKGKIVERDKEGNAQRIVGTYIDITEKKRKTQEILEAIIKTEDNERQRISKDIHDGLQQTLTISSLNFQSVKKNISTLSDNIIDKFETGWEYLQKSITESRSVAHSLMPKAITDFGIISACDSLITEADKSSEEIQFSFFHNFEEHQIENHQIEITLYRILQEGINNIFKYSKATKVDIQLKNYEDIYMLTIEDNGVGFDVSKVMQENMGLGFKGMKNRLDAIDGFLEVESREGRGTTLLIEINKNF